MSTRETPSQSERLGSKLGALSAFSGKAPSNPDTVIQNASLNAHVASEMTGADAINVTVPSLGVVTGAGTISPAGALDFNMIADLQTARSEARAERRGGGGDSGGISFKIQGTTSNPSFVPDVSDLARNAAKGAIQQSVTGKTGVGGGAFWGRGKGNSGPPPYASALKSLMGPVGRIILRELRMDTRSITSCAIAP